MLPPLDRQTLRRRSVPHFIRSTAEHHPQLRRPVTYAEFSMIAVREGIIIRVVPSLSHAARLIRVGAATFIQFRRDTSRQERAVLGMHELCHFWRDDPGQACYFADEDDMRPLEEFADVFAWFVTSPARVHVRGLREEDM